MVNILSLRMTNSGPENFWGHQLLVGQLVFLLGCIAPWFTDSASVANSLIVGAFLILEARLLDILENQQRCCIFKQNQDDDDGN